MEGLQILRLACARGGRGLRGIRQLAPETPLLAVEGMASPAHRGGGVWLQGARLGLRVQGLPLDLDLIRRFLQPGLVPKRRRVLGDHRGFSRQGLGLLGLLLFLLGDSHFDDLVFGDDDVGARAPGVPVGRVAFEGKAGFTVLRRDETVRRVLPTELLGDLLLLQVLEPGLFLLHPA